MMRKSDSCVENNRSVLHLKAKFKIKKHKKKISSSFDMNFISTLFYIFLQFNYFIKTIKPKNIFYVNVNKAFFPN